MSGTTDRWLPRVGETPPAHLARVCEELRHDLDADDVAVWIRDPGLGRLRPSTFWSDPEGASADLEDDRPVPTGDVHREELPLGGDHAGDALLIITPAAAADGAALAQVRPLLATAAAQALTWLEAEGRRTRAELLIEVVETAASHDGLDDVLASVCQTVASVLDVRRVCVFLREDGRLVPRMARYSSGRRDEDLWSAFLDPDEPFRFGEMVIERGEPVLARVGEQDEQDWWAERFDVGSAVGVPLGTGDDPLGVLTLDSRNPDRFSQEHVRLGAAIASHLTGVIERARAAGERATELRISAAVNRLLEEAAGATSIADAARSLALVLHECLETEHAVAYLRGRDGRITEAMTIGVPDRLSRFLREQLVGEVADAFPFFHRMTDPGVIALDDASSSELLAPEMVEQLQLRSFIALPVLGSEGPIGVVEAGTTREQRRWSDEDRRLAERLAVEGSLVVENAALREHEQQRLAELSHRAFHDPLTSLPNRALLLDRIEHALARSERTPQGVAVLFVDLDRFKWVNDTLGHEAGDRVLVEIARRLSGAVRPGDTVARLSGDEFVVVLEGITAEADTTRVAQRIVAALERPHRVSGRDITISASIGVALGSSDVTDPEDLLRRADFAMYRAKRSGGAQFERYEEVEQAEQSRPLHLDEELRGGIDRGEITVRYQPIVVLDSERIVAAEALARWRHPRLGLLPPRHFVAIAEEAGLARDIDAIVLEEACEQLVTWQHRTGSDDLSVFVNLAPAQLRRPELGEVVSRAVENARLDPQRLVLELPEDALVDEPERTLTRLQRLKETGVRLAVDGFGSGRLPLRDLQRLPLDLLKIARAFVDGAATETGDAALVRAIVDVAGALGLGVVAEGIETTPQLTVLRRLDCEYGQGYLFERPADPSRVETLLRRQERYGIGWTRRGQNGGAASVPAEATAE